ncbi:MAG: DUF192 domain-containing protein [Nitrososphaerales archaeon]
MQKKLLIIVPVIAAVLIAIALFLPVTSRIQQTQPVPFEYEVRKITIDGVPLIVEVADDSEKTARGLMYRDHLPEDRGMLFIFEREHRYQFWMMNMKINLDIIWLDSNGKVVHIVEDAKPCIDEGHTSLCTYNPDEPAKYVLEVNAGFVQKYGINENSVMKVIP